MRQGAGAEHLPDGVYKHGKLGEGVEVPLCIELGNLANAASDLLERTGFVGIGIELGAGSRNPACEHVHDGRHIVFKLGWQILTGEVVKHLKRHVEDLAEDGDGGGRRRGVEEGVMCAFEQLEMRESEFFEDVVDLGVEGIAAKGGSPPVKDGMCCTEDTEDELVILTGEFGNEVVHEVGPVVREVVVSDEGDGIFQLRSDVGGCGRCAISSGRDGHEQRNDGLLEREFILGWDGRL